jgi:hypothetical protein
MSVEYMEYIFLNETLAVNTGAKILLYQNPRTITNIIT